LVFHYFVFNALFTFKHHHAPSKSAAAASFDRDSKFSAPGGHEPRPSRPVVTFMGKTMLQKKYPNLKHVFSIFDDVLQKTYVVLCSINQHIIKHFCFRLMTQVVFSVDPHHAHSFFGMTHHSKTL
jgi:hypothetical protein